MPSIFGTSPDFQDPLVSGVNIKTINGQSVLGSGNLEVSGGVVSSNTNWLFVGTTTGELRVYRQTASRTFTLLPLQISGLGFVRGVSTNQQGNMVAVAHESAPYLSIFSFDNTNGALSLMVTQPLNIPSLSGRCVHFSPDGDFIIAGFGTTSPVYRMWSYSGTNFTTRVQASLSTDSPNFVQWSRDSLAVVFTSGTNSTVNAFLRSGNSLSTLSIPSITTDGLANFNGASWSENKLVLTGSGTQAASIQCWTWNGISLSKVNDDRIAKHLSGSTGNMRQNHFNPSGSLLFCGLTDEPRVSVRLSNASGLINPLDIGTTIPQSMVLAGVNDGILSVGPNATCSATRVSGDGKYLAVASATASGGVNLIISDLDGFVAGKTKHENTASAACLDWWPRAED